MASPQVEDGYTPIANELIEAFYRVNLSPYEARVIWYLLRKTYGWSKKTDRITLSKFAKDIGITRQNVFRTLRNLYSREITVIYRDDKNRLSYGIQKNYERWKLSSPESTVVSKEYKTVLSGDTHKRKEKKKDAAGGSKAPLPPYGEIATLYGATLPGLPEALPLTPRRMSLLKASWNCDVRHRTMQFWKEYFEFIRDSCPKLHDFAMWPHADFEWIINQNNIPNVMGGNFAIDE